MPCDIIKVQRVVCEDTFILTDDEPCIPIQRPLLPGSQIDRTKTTVKVNMTDCTLTKRDNTLYADIVFAINKEITINQPQGVDVNLEYSFQKAFTDLPFRCCCPSLLHRVCPDRLYCELFSIEAKDDISLQVEDSCLAEFLTITARIKVVYDDQIRWPGKLPCPKPVKCPLEVEIAAGKIRNQIGNPCFKKWLLAKIKHLKRLLRQGKVTEALALLAAIISQIQFRIGHDPSLKIPFTLVMADLLLAQKALLKFL